MAQAGTEPLVDPPPTLKTLLAAGTALLQPPSPLPANPTELVARLKASSARLSPSWRETHTDWSENTELEQVGDDDASNAVRRKIRRDDLVLIVAGRSLSLLVGMQGWLQKECWPEALRRGLKPSDYMLGGVDHKLVQLLVSHTVSSLLLQLSITYEAHLKTNNGEQTASKLSSALKEVLDLLAAPQMPPQPSGPSSAPRLPSTAITIILLKHAPNILLSCILLAFTPTTEPPVHASLRQQFQRTLNQMGPTHVLGALGATLQILTSGQKEKSPVRGWIRPWPAYVLQTVRQSMSAQIVKPGGPRGFISYLFAESTTSIPEERRLELVTKTLMLIPKDQTEDKYISRLLFDLIKLVAPQSKPSPKIYVHASSYTIFKVWEKYRETTEKWMRMALCFPSAPPESQGKSLGDCRALIDSEMAQRMLESLWALSIYAPPSPLYLQSLFLPNLHPLFALFTYRYISISDAEVREVARRGKTANSDRSPQTAASVLLMLDTWFRVASKEEVVGALWELVTGKSLWKRDIERKYVLGWQGPAGKEEIAMRPYAIVLTQLSRRLHSADFAAIESSSSVDMESVLKSIAIDPDPEAFVALLKSMERPEIASEIFLKLLNYWRATHNKRDAPSLLGVQYLRIVSRILEVFGTKILTISKHLLIFVESVLSDAINEGNQSQPKVQMIGESRDRKNLTEEISVESVLSDAINGGNQSPQPKVQVIGESRDRNKMTEEAEIDELGSLDLALRILHATLIGLEPNEEIQKLLLPIASHIKQVASQTTSPEIRALSKEVLEKLASTQLSPTGDSTQDEYGHAVQLLNDPILPVRAHGLKMLSDIVKGPQYDPSMTPKILEHFQKALWDEESFIYLQASKHLASLVYVLGAAVFNAVWKLYEDLLEGTKKAPEEQMLDRVLRVGETLDVIIIESGKAFSVHAASVIPTLIATFVDSKLPTIVRASSLAILSSCVEADYLSLLPWGRELLSGVIDLIQVESVQDSPFKPATAGLVPSKPKVVLIEDEEPEPEIVEEAAEKKPLTIDDEPTNTEDGKHPALRRAAIAFLDTLFDHLYRQNSDDDKEPSNIQFKAPIAKARITPDANALLGFDVPLLQSALVPLLYIAETDVDETTRAQATSAAASACALIELVVMP